MTRQKTDPECSRVGKEGGRIDTLEENWGFLYGRNIKRRQAEGQYGRNFSVHAAWKLARNPWFGLIGQIRLRLTTPCTSMYFASVLSLLLFLFFSSSSSSSFSSLKNNKEPRCCRRCGLALLRAVPLKPPPPPKEKGPLKDTTRRTGLCFFFLFFLKKNN